MKDEASGLLLSELAQLANEEDKVMDKTFLGIHANLCHPADTEGLGFVESELEAFLLRRI